MFLEVTADIVRAADRVYMFNVHNSMSACKINDPLIPDDCVAVRITNTSVQIVVVSVYRSPSLNVTESVLMSNKLNNFFESITSDQILIVAGDFNFPGTRWQAGISDAAGNSWLNLFVERNFSFLLPDGTVTRERVVADSYQSSSLDQVMCSEDNVLTTFSIEKPLGKSDHMCIIFKALLSTDYDFITQRKINWSRSTAKTA